MEEAQQQSQDLLANLDKDIEWLAKWKTYHMATFISMKTIEIVAAAAIPVSAVALPGDKSKLISSLLAAVILVVQGLIELLGSRQKWTNYVETKEALEREQRRYIHNVTPYDKDDRISKFLDRIDAIQKSDFETWSKLMDAATRTSKGPESATGI